QGGGAPADDPWATGAPAGGPQGGGQGGGGWGGGSGGGGGYSDEPPF
ncbi:single-stranded DNA-binding protein, partial [Streptomyces sp. WAC02707]